MIGIEVSVLALLKLTLATVLQFIGRADGSVSDPPTIEVLKVNLLAE